jgi:hypothetical protein
MKTRRGYWHSNTNRLPFNFLKILKIFGMVFFSNLIQQLLQWRKVTFLNWFSIHRFETHFLYQVSASTLNRKLFAGVWDQLTDRDTQEETADAEELLMEISRAFYTNGIWIIVNWMSDVLMIEFWGIVRCQKLIDILTPGINENGRLWSWIHRWSNLQSTM